jgi:hypothetical protein
VTGVAPGNKAEPTQAAAIGLGKTINFPPQTGQEKQQGYRGNFA